MRIRMLFAAVFCALVTVASPTRGGGALNRSAAPRTEILWDTFGIPHVYSKDAAGAFRAFGWAQAMSHGDLLLRLYGRARGRAAEYWGESELESDRWVHTVGIPRRAREWYEAQTPEFRRLLDAFAEGVNAYVKAHPDQIADEVEVVSPVDGVDVLAHVQRVIHFTFVVSRYQVAEIAESWKKRAPAATPPSPSAGSNAWAIAPSRSASRRAMLLANPHLPWNDLFLFYEAHLVGPAFDISGATLVGFPMLAIAFNDAVGWTHTVNFFDGADLYELTVTGDGYQWDGTVKPFAVEEQSLAVRQPDGSKRTEVLRVRRSVHGPVVAEKEGRALALRSVGLDQPGICEQWWDMGRARDLGTFEAALRRLQIPLFTVMYADRDGHILHLFGGRTPVRPAGDWDWRAVVPGDTSRTLWTSTHAYDELPKVVDPPSGWLQNANDPPWLTTLPAPLDPQRYPAYMSGRGMDFRAQRSARMLHEDDRITFDELVEYKHSTVLELANRVLDDLAAAVSVHGDERARRAITVLDSWDRAADAGSRGAVLFQAWARELEQRTEDRAAFAVSWDPKAPLQTPDGLADPGLAAAALSSAAERVEKTFGSLDVPWGDVNRLRRAGLDLPANGGLGPLGAFRVVGLASGKDGKNTVSSGDSYVAAVEFSSPLRAQALLAYGNASQPGSKHAVDQLPLFARKQLRAVWRTRADVEAHLEKREVVQ
jgi:acyl-homoserine-lactone acylase